MIITEPTKEQEIARIREVTRHVTSDGTEHTSLTAAHWHAGEIAAAERANATLMGGGTVADALRNAGWDSEIPAIVERITRDTKLVISHWQCRDQAGYQVRSFRSDRRVFVHGDAGSWSGPYGGDMSIRDLAGYAGNKGTFLLK